MLIDNEEHALVNILGFKLPLFKLPDHLIAKTLKLKRLCLE